MNWCSKNGICTEPGDAGYCICNRGYYSADCSKQFCPKAYDPMVVTETSDHPRRSIILTVGLVDDVPGRIGGNLVFEFNKDTVTFSPLSSSQQCTAFIEKLPGVRTAKCVKETNVLPYVFKIEFTAFSVQTIESNVYTHDGNPSLGDFFCGNGNMMGESAEAEEAEVYCTVSDLNTDNLPVYAECSQHGECNSRSGQCSCARGFYGPACDDTADTADHHVFEHDGPYFTGTVMKSVAYRSRSDEFNVFQAGVASSSAQEMQVYLTVRGDGQLTHSGGDVLVDGGKVSVQGLDPNQDSLLDLAFDGGAWKDSNSNATLIKGSTVLSGQFHMQLFNTETPSDAEEQQTFSVLNISAQGDLSTSGNLCAANRTFVVEDGMVLAESLNVVNSLDVHGSANIEDSLTIGSGFALTPEGMTIDSSTHSGPLLELRSMQDNFDGALLEINTVKGSASSALIRATVDDVVTFDVSTGGSMTLQTLHLKSGGIEVDAGGIAVKSGGLEVGGGFKLLSGDFELSDNNLKAKSFHAESENMVQTLLSLSSKSEDYAGTAINVEFSGEKSKRFNVLEAKAAGGENIVSIDGAGSVVAAGDSSVGGNLAVAGSSHLQGGLSFDKASVSAGEHITIPTTTGVYTEISNDGKDSHNEIMFEKGKYNGQISVVTNLDSEVTTGDAVIHPGSTLMFVYNDGKWRALEALAAHFEEITKVKKLEVQNDIFIGNHTLSAGGLKLLHLARGDVLVGGLDGQLRTRKGFTFSNGVLSTPSLNADQLGGPLDAHFHVISDAVLENSHLKDASIVAKDIRLAHLSGIAYFDEKGHLKSTREFQIDGDGQLHLSDLWNDIDLHSSDLNNVGVLRATELKGIKNAEIETLLFSSSSETKTEPGSLAFLGNDHSLQFSSSVNVSSDGSLNIDKMGGYEQVGTVDFNSSQLLSPVIVGGSADQLTSISAENIQLLLAGADKDASALSAANTNTLAVLTPEGLLQRDDGSKVNTAVALEVASLSVTTDLHVPSVASPSAEEELVSVSVLGAVSKTGQVVKSGVAMLGKTLTASSIDTTSLSVETMSFKDAANAGGGGVLMTSATGQVASSTVVEVDSLTSATLLVTGVGSVDSLAITSLASKTASGDTLSLVVVDPSGQLSAPETLSVQVANIAATTSMSAPVLKIPGEDVNGVLTVVDDAGTIAGRSSIRVMEVTATEAVTVEGELTAGSVKLTGLAGAGAATGAVLSADESGVLGFSSRIAVEEASVNAATAKTLSVSALHLPEIAADSLLQVTEGGRVQKATRVQVDAVQASSLDISGDVVFSSAKGASVLSTDATGKVMHSSAASLTSLAVSDDATVGSLVASSLSVPSLKGGVMTVSSTGGEVTSSTNLEITSVDAAALKVSGKATLGSLQFSGTDAGVGVLIADKSGVVTASGDVALESVTVSGTVTTQALTVDKMAFTSGLQNTLLAVDASGVVSAATAQHLAHLASETITSEKGSFQALHFTPPVPKGKGIDGKSRLMTVGAGGEVSTDNTIEMLHVSADTLSVEMADVQALLLPNFKEGDLLTIGAQGLVTAAETVRVSDVTASAITGNTLVADNLKVTSLASSDGKDLVSVGTDGFLRSATDVKVNALGSQSLVVTGEASIESLSVGAFHFKDNKKASGTARSVLGVDSASGNIVPVTDLAVEFVRSSSAAVTGTVSAAQFKLTGSSTYGVLGVTEDGSLEAVSEATIKSLTTSTLSTESLTLQKAGIGGVLVANKDGNVASTQSVSLSDLEVSSTLSVAGAVTSAELQVSSLANGGASSLLTADSKGTIQFTSDANIDTLTAKSIVVSSSASVTSLLLQSLKSAPLLATTADGTVTSANSLAGLESLQAGDVSAKTLTAADSFTMPAITSAAVLSTDQTGRVVASSELTLAAAHVTALTASTLSASSVQVSGLAGRGGVVSANNDGHLVTSKDLTIEELSTTTMTASKSIHAPALVLSSAKSASLLITNSEGAISASNKLEVPSVMTDSMTVSGLSAMANLQVRDLSSTKPALLAVDNKGHVSASSDVKVTSLEATDAFLSGTLSTPGVVIPGANVGGVLSVVNSKGGVESTSSVKLVDITTEQLEVSGVAVLSDLRVKALATKSASTSDLVAVDSTGKLTSIPNLDAYLPNMKDSSFSTVDVSDTVTARSFRVSGGDLVDGMVMSVDKQGVVKPSSTPTLTGLTVTSDLKVDGAIQASKVVLDEPASSLLYSNARKEVEALSGSQILKDGTLSLATAKIDSLVGDVSVNGHAINGAKIQKALIKESELFLDSSAAKHGGNLALRNLESGLLEYSDAIAINSAGFLKTNGFVPMSSDGNIVISKATMSDSTLSNVIISDATSVSTKSLTVNGAAQFSDDIFVEGSITVRGTVMGSGPYVDSSDIRFKKNVSPITNALDKVCAMGGDYYEYRLEEYPDRGFESGRQMGWIANTVEKVAPELVREDSEGFKHVAYARSSALLAAAVKEMKDQFEVEMEALSKELRATQKEVVALKKLLM